MNTATELLNEASGTLNQKGADYVNVSRNLAELASGTLDAAKERIKELESQMPKVVVPTEHDRKRGTAYCACEAMISEWDKYCTECGAQLNWEGLK